MRKTSFGHWLVFAALVLSSARALAASGDYWQQHVHYTIDVTLIDSIHTLDGVVNVVYTNNSPDTLREVYFHLYSNAFQHGSLMEERAKAEDSWLQYRFDRLGPKEEGRYWITDVMVMNSHGLPSEIRRPQITGTIMRVEIPALIPGASTTLSIPFREQIPLQTRRSGWMSEQGVLYSMAQWYPKIAEYDREGWQAQEYVSHEFYGVWGDFDVTLHVPSRFTVGASGQCQNPEEAGHGYERIAHGEKEGREAPHTGEQGMTTWRFHASPVHDFAWVADEYVHDWKTWNDSVTIHSIYKPNVAAGWQDVLKYTEFALATYSDLYGQWPYRNFSTTQAGDGGMEYPQLIMNTNGGAGLIAHEAGHQWFYGLLGSNETREAFMDEGFTQYIASVEMQKQFGRYLGADANRSWLDWFIPIYDNKSDNYRSYQSLARSGYEEPLVIPHDWFREGVNAVQVYMKMLSGLSMLEYSLGDNTFARGMKHYFADWHFKHPHLLDFQREMERASGTDLDWFFDEWFRTTRTIDYEAVGVDSKPLGDSGFETTVRLRNNQLGVAPIDLLLHYSDGTTEQATIPISVNQGLAYHKDGTSLFFPGWDWPAKEYSGAVTTTKSVSWFEIDTSWRLQDLNWLNNYSQRLGLPSPRGYWRVWQDLMSRPPLDGYYAVARPIVWYTDANGFEGGAGLRYGMNDAFSGDLKLVYKATPPGASSALAHLDGRATCSSPVDWLGRLSTFSAKLDKMDGIFTVRAELKKTFRAEYLNYGATHSAGLILEQQRLSDAAYPFYHHDWAPGATQSATLWYFVNRGQTNFGVSTEQALPGSDSSYSRLTARYETVLGIPFDQSIKIRAIAATASDPTPAQKRYLLSRANAYEEQENDFFRGMTDVSGRFDANARPFVEGGAGVRGYNAFDSSISGKHMAGLSLDISLPNPLLSLWAPLHVISAGLFADAGWVGGSNYDIIGSMKRDLRTDAGLKIGFDLLGMLPYQLRGVAGEYAQVPIITAIFPFYVNHPLDAKGPFAFRWALSLGTSF